MLVIIITLIIALVAIAACSFILWQVNSRMAQSRKETKNTILCHLDMWVKDYKQLAEQSSNREEECRYWAFHKNLKWLHQAITQRL